MKNTLSDKIQRALTGFAAGVMVAASVWSLIIPAIEQSASMGKLSFLPAAVGFWIGILFLLLLDHIIPHLHQNSDQAEGPKSKLQRTTMMVLAVTLHNIPEYGRGRSLCRLSLRQHNHHRRRCTGIIPWHRYPEFSGRRHHIHAPSRRRYEEKQSFVGGVLSGIVEPVGGILTILAAHYILPALPYLLSFAAGAMLYVVVEELIPEMSQGRHSDVGTLCFAVGFSLMMILDVSLRIKNFFVKQNFKYKNHQRHTDD